MKTIEINVQEPYYSFILNGQKIVEGRLNKGKFKDIEVGDEIVINQESRFKVLAKNIYLSFREMIEKEGVENVVPDAKSIEDAINAYYKFYSKEDEQEFGVVAIGLSTRI